MGEFDKKTRLPSFLSQKSSIKRLLLVVLLPCLIFLGAGLGLDFLQKRGIKDKISNVNKVIEIYGNLGLLLMKNMGENLSELARDQNPQQEFSKLTYSCVKILDKTKLSELLVSGYEALKDVTNSIPEGYFSETFYNFVKQKMEGMVCEDQVFRIREDLVVNVSCKNDEILTKGIKTSLIYIFENLRDIIENSELQQAYPLGLKAGFKIIASDTFNTMEKQFYALNIGIMQILEELRMSI